MIKDKQLQPLISVIMPVYNGELFVAEAIESILNQTYQHFEFIIINDCSSDQTPAILNHYHKQFPKKIRIIHLEKRLGAYGAINFALKNIQGKFIALMDSDDVSYPHRLEKQVAYLKLHPQVIVLGTQAKIIDKNGNVTGKKVFCQSNQGIYRQFMTVHPLVHPSCMIKRSLLPDRKNLYFNQFGTTDDYYTFFNLLQYGQFANLPEFLLDYRIHFKNSSLQHLKAKFFTSIKIRFLAIRDFHYQPTLSGIIKSILQIMIIALIPESILLNLYLLVKGMKRFPQFRFGMTVKNNLALTFGLKNS